MIPTSFDYTRVDTVDEAIDLLIEQDGARALAGGHSLLPDLKLRRTSARLLIDLWPLRAELAGIDERDGVITVGALTRYTDLERSSVVQEHLPLLAHAAGQIGDTQVRRRGTIGGSLANAARAADLPGVALALDGEVVVRGAEGERTLPVDQLLLGDHRTSLDRGELITHIRFPLRRVDGWSYQRFGRRTQDWPTVAVAANRTESGTAVALVNLADHAVRAASVEEAVATGAQFPEAARRVEADIAPRDDLKASAAYRRHLAGVLVERALQHAA